MSSRPTTSPSTSGKFNFESIFTPSESILINEFSIESQDSYKQGKHNFISYESVCGSSTCSKEIQTELVGSRLGVQDLVLTVKEIQKKCKKYKKQNKELRKEIKAVQEEKENEQVSALKEEICRLRGKIGMHQMMAEKIGGIVGEISEDFELGSEENADFRVYSAIIGKIEGIRNRFKEFAQKIRSLESDKSSMGELLNFYATTSKLLNYGKGEMSEKNLTAGISLTPDCVNPAYCSRKSSSLTENSLNTIKNTLLAELKKAYNSEFETIDNSKQMNSGLRGTQKLTKGGGSVRKLKTRPSISPFIPKPQGLAQKSGKGSRTNLLKGSKTTEEDQKQRRIRYKS